MLAEAEHRGLEALRLGRVGAILVAGGQGTRLGASFPKGMLPIGPVSGCTLYQLFAEQLLARSRRAGAVIPYYIMTSDATHAATVEFFQREQHFGLDPEAVRFFRQGTMPAVDDEGRWLLTAKGRLATTPDGHGGLLTALKRAGLLDNMRRRGIETLYYHQVDNPTAIVCDPWFIGHHLMRGAEMSTKVVAKRSADERMGVVVEIDGVTQIIEYSDLPPEVARQRDARGELVLWAGSTAMHVFERAFLERVANDGSALPFHRAHKKVPHLAETGRVVEPSAPNAWKFERFIFDAMPHTRRALVVEADRAREFNPVKNAEGADSPETAQRAMIANAQRLLAEAGIDVPSHVPVEISPLFALNAAELRAKVTPAMLAGDAILLR